jgi:hypothetical protein
MQRRITLFVPATRLPYLAAAATARRHQLTGRGGAAGAPDLLRRLEVPSTASWAFADAHTASSVRRNIRAGPPRGRANFHADRTKTLAPLMAPVAQRAPDHPILGHDWCSISAAPSVN